MSPKKMSQAAGRKELDETEYLIRTAIFDLLHLLSNLSQERPLSSLRKSLREFHAKVSEHEIDALYHRLGFSVVKKLDAKLNESLKKYRAKKISREEFSASVRDLFSGAVTGDELEQVVVSFLSVKGMKNEKGEDEERNYRSLSEEAFARYLEVSSGSISNHKRKSSPTRYRLASESLPEALAKLFDLPNSSAIAIASIIGREIERAAPPVFSEAEDVTNEAELGQMAGAAQKILLDQMKPRLKLNKALLKKQRNAK